MDTNPKLTDMTGKKPRTPSYKYSFRLNEEQNIRFNELLCKAGSFAERIRPIALPLLKSAAEETGDSFILTTLFNGERLMIASVSGNSVISVNPEAVERERKFNYSRVTTHVLLAFAPETERKMFLESNPVPPGAWPEMEHELAEIRRLGICAKDRTDNGFFAAARPVYTRKNVFIGALGGYIPIAEATPEKNAGLCRVLDRIAQEITNLTGELS